MADATFDVFVSYRHREPDQSWVRGRLVPRLMQENVRVLIDVHDFDYGVPVVVSMERAVEASRFTLCVVTPAFMESSFTEIEQLMAAQLGQEQARRRLLVVLREHVDMPEIDSRCVVDMCDSTQFEPHLALLTEKIRQGIDA